MPMLAVTDRPRPGTGIGDDCSDRLAPTLRLSLGIVSAQKQYEFLSAKTERMNVRVRLERFGHDFQHGVTDSVAVSIIDCFKVIQAEHSKCAVAFGTELLEILFDCPPVE